MEWYYYPLTILAGFIAGFINTIAGSGSVITLTMLSTLGLPSTLANGTNRIGVLLQSITGTIAYQKKAPISLKNYRGIIAISVVGALLGTQLAIELNPRILNFTIGILMIFLLGLILFKPKDWLKEQAVSTHRPKWLRYAIFFFIGIYGGFIQAGVGVFLLSALILGEGLTMVKSNAIKIVIVLFYTIPSLFLFLYYGQVHWKFGLLLGVGQIIGAWLSARFATGHPQANKLIRYLLIGILIFSIYRFFSLAVVS